MPKVALVVLGILAIILFCWLLYSLQITGSSKV